MDKRRKKEEEKWKESVNKSLQSSMHGWERRSQTQLRMRVGVYLCIHVPISGVRLIAWVLKSEVYMLICIYPAQY